MGPRGAILLVLFVTAVNGRFLDNMLELIIRRAMSSGLTSNGQIENCGQTTFSGSWTPDTLVIGQSVTIQVTYTFPKTFVSGVASINLNGFSQDMNVNCQMLVRDGNCSEHRTISESFPLVVPTAIASLPNPMNVTVKVTDENQFQFLCAHAVVHYQQQNIKIFQETSRRLTQSREISN